MLDLTFNKERLFTLNRLLIWLKTAYKKWKTFIARSSFFLKGLGSFLNETRSMHATPICSDLEKILA